MFHDAADEDDYRKLIEKRDRMNLGCKLSNDAVNHLIEALAIPPLVYEGATTGSLFLARLSHYGLFDPYKIAYHLASLNHSNLAHEFNKFAKEYFPETDVFPLNFTLRQDTVSEVRSIYYLFNFLNYELNSENLEMISESEDYSFTNIIKCYKEKGYIDKSLRYIKLILVNVLKRHDLIDEINICAEQFQKFENEEFMKGVEDFLKSKYCDTLSVQSTLKKYFQTFHCMVKQIGDQNIFHIDEIFVPLNIVKFKNRNIVSCHSQDDDYIIFSDDIVDINDVGGIKHQGNILAILGNSGSGKTMLCKYLLSKYCKGEIIQDYILYLNCRETGALDCVKYKVDNNSNCIKGIIKMLTYACPPELKSQKDFCTDILFTQSSKLMLIIDSVEQLTTSLSDFKNCMLYYLLTRKVLTQSTLILASRPGFWSDIIANYKNEMKIDKQLEIKEFTTSQRDDFLTKKLFNSKYSISLKDLLNDPKLSEFSLYSLNPFNSSILAFLGTHAQFLNFSEFTSRAEIYNHIVSLLITNTCEIKNLDTIEYCISNSLVQLDYDSKPYFIEVCRLAFDNLKKGNNSFNEYDGIKDITRKLFQSLSSDTFIVSNIGINTSRIYYFNDKMQEFLSAWYLYDSIYLNNGDYNALKTALNENAFRYLSGCLIFLCELLGSNSDTLLDTIISSELIMEPIISNPITNWSTIIYSKTTINLLNILSCINATGKIEFYNKIKHIPNVGIHIYIPNQINCRYQLDGFRTFSKLIYKINFINIDIETFSCKYLEELLPDLQPVKILHIRNVRRLKENMPKFKLFKELSIIFYNFSIEFCNIDFNQNRISSEVFKSLEEIKIDYYFKECHLTQALLIQLLRNENLIQIKCEKAEIIFDSFRKYLPHSIVIRSSPLFKNNSIFVKSKKFYEFLSSYDNTEEIMLTKSNYLEILSNKSKNMLSNKSLSILKCDFMNDAYENERNKSDYNNLFQFISNCSTTLVEIEFSAMADFLKYKYNWNNCINVLKGTIHVKCLTFLYCNILNTQLSQLSSEVINNMNKLLVLEISHNEQKYLPIHNMKDLVENMHTNNTLRVIKFSHCDLNTGFINVLETLCQKCTALIYLRLCGNEQIQRYKQKFESEYSKLELIL